MVCPNCKNRKKVSLILKENLIIGNTESLDYGDVYQSILQTSQTFDPQSSLDVSKQRRGSIEIQITESK